MLMGSHFVYTYSQANMVSFFPHTITPHRKKKWKSGFISSWLKIYDCSAVHIFIFAGIMCHKQNVLWWWSGHLRTQKKSRLGGQDTTGGGHKTDVPFFSNKCSCSDQEGIQIAEKLSNTQGSEQRRYISRKPKTANTWPFPDPSWVMQEGFKTIPASKAC